MRAGRFRHHDVGMKEWRHRQASGTVSRGNHWLPFGSMVGLVIVLGIALASTAVGAQRVEPTVPAPVAGDPAPGTAVAGPGRTVHVAATAKPPALSTSELARLSQEMGPGQSGPALPSGPPLRRSVRPPEAIVKSGALLPQPKSAPTDLVTFRKTDLGSGLGSLVNEPSIASNGTGVLETWNWYAAKSADGGATFTYINPMTAFPVSGGGYCCDQVVYYEASRDLYIWVIQYLRDANGNNIERLVVAKGAAGLAAGTFKYWDLPPQQVGAPTGRWYDQNKLATTTNYFYITAGIYDNSAPNNLWQASVVMRFSLDDLASLPTNLPYSYLGNGAAALPSMYFSPGMVERGTDTLYFGAHRNNTTLRLYAWPESGAVTTTDVTHSSFIDFADSHNCARTGSPSTANWCLRADARTPNGWIAGGMIGFGWSAQQGTAGLGTFPYPYVHVVRINSTTKALVDEPIIWSSSTAYQFPSFATNDRGDLGAIAMFGGGTAFESCAALVRDTTSGNAWALLGVVGSDSDTAAPNGGDYTSTDRNGGNDHIWSGGCYALSGGGNNANTHTYYVSFGRQQDAPTPSAPTGVIATAGNASAVVGWTAPASNGGNAITQYVVTPYVGTTPGAPTTVGNVTSASIAGLTNGTTYTFTVTARNLYGAGPESTPSNAVTPSALPLQPISYPAVIRNGVWYLRDSNTSAPGTVTSFAYGAPTDTPVFGDWNGDGVETPGLVRVTGGSLTWYLRNTNSAGAPDIIFTWGAATDKPLVGDWDGNGTDTPGLLRGTTGGSCATATPTGPAASSTSSGGIGAPRTPSSATGTATAPTPRAGSGPGPATGGSCQAPTLDGTRSPTSSGAPPPRPPGWSATGTATAPTTRASCAATGGCCATPTAGAGPPTATSSSASTATPSGSGPSEQARGLIGRRAGPGTSVPAMNSGAPTHHTGTFGESGLVPSS